MQVIIRSSKRINPYLAVQTAEMMMFNRFELRLRTFIGFLQFSLNLPFIPNLSLSGGEYGAYFARKNADVGKMWGNLRKEKSLNLLFLKV